MEINPHYRKGLWHSIPSLSGCLSVSCPGSIWHCVVWNQEAGWILQWLFLFSHFVRELHRSSGKVYKTTGAATFLHRGRRGPPHWTSSIVPTKARFITRLPIPINASNDSQLFQQDCRGPGFGTPSTSCVQTLLREYSVQCYWQKGKTPHLQTVCLMQSLEL
jgi:hypothetical protein